MTKVTCKHAQYDELMEWDAWNTGRPKISRERANTCQKLQGTILSDSTHCLGANVARARRVDNVNDLGLTVSCHLRQSTEYSRLLHAPNIIIIASTGKYTLMQQRDVFLSHAVTCMCAAPGSTPVSSTHTTTPRPSYSG
jgi:hypothetical protein